MTFAHFYLLGCLAALIGVAKFFYMIYSVRKTKDDFFGITGQIKDDFENKLTMLKDQIKKWGFSIAGCILLIIALSWISAAFILAMELDTKKLK